jgi:pyruvate dehydrogenase E2 component (dihydrolipoamide acetyltransferase)
MAVEITVPRLGWNMEEGVFVGWLKREGEPVRAGEALFTLEGEKSTEDIESLDTGILRFAPGGPKAGDKVAVGAVIGYLDGPGAAAAAPAESVAPRASPRARRVARDLGVDWTQLPGSGRAGRVRERDVRAAAPDARPAAPPPSGGVPAGPVRKAIAERLTTSLRSTAPVTLTTTADASNLVNLRGQFQAAQSGDEVIPGYTDLLVKLAAAALQRHPMLCARWDGDVIVPAQSIDIGIAVDTDAGLLVPVVRDAPALSLRQVAARARDLAERARRGALRSEDMEGGAFTITNLGAFGVDAFTPIINYPQCAVLGVGRIQRRPVAAGEQVVVREQITLSLTFDHRIVDGAPAACFLQTLVALVENPGPALMP